MVLIVLKIMFHVMFEIDVVECCRVLKTTLTSRFRTRILVHIRLLSVLRSQSNS